MGFARGLYPFAARLRIGTPGWIGCAQDRRIPVTVIRHVVFRGRVQGVGFRPRVADGAAGPFVGGWVGNRRDGTVEAVFAGDTKAVDDTIAGCRRGSHAARVDGVEIRDARDDEL